MLISSILTKNHSGKVLQKILKRRKSSLFSKHKVIVRKYLSLWTLLIQVRSVVWQRDFTKDNNFCILMAAKITIFQTQKRKNYKMQDYCTWSNTYVSPSWPPLPKVAQNHVYLFSPSTPLLAHLCCEAAWLISISTHQCYLGLKHTANHKSIINNLINTWTQSARNFS